MNNMKFIPSMGNLTTHVYTDENPFAFKYFEKLERKEIRTFYDAYLIDSDTLISPGDLCIVTHPYDSEEYVERCDKVTVDDVREVFYGEEGTRCLLIDAIKIIGTTNSCFKEVKQIIVTEQILQEFNSKPLSFMEEDLLE